MGNYVERLPRPYDFRVLIEAYIYANREDFVHDDFKTYYVGLLKALEGLFELSLSDEGLTFTHTVLWMHFRSTVYSLLRLTTPWEGYLEDTLLTTKLEQSGEPGKQVIRAGKVIHEAKKKSESAHREILYALFVAIFGDCSRVVTSEELLKAGFDDSKEPKISDYYAFF